MVHPLPAERLIVIVFSSWIFVNGLELARSAAAISGHASA
jgi:hypothetical protein